jgi:Predicted carbamoyl transferase, NodU family
MHMGITYGHGATVALLSDDGTLVYCESEERFNKVKGSTGMPYRTVEYIYDTICAPEDIKTCTLYHGWSWWEVIRNEQFKSHPFARYLAGSPRCSRVYRANTVDPNSLLPAFDVTEYLKHDYTTVEERNTKARAFFAAATRLPPEKINALHHHIGHAYSGLPFYPDDRPRLIFTHDGYGDGLCATVGRYKDGELRFASTTSHELTGTRIFSRVTGLLGMKVNEHESKLMGLAPYAKAEYAEPLADELGRMQWVDDEGKWQIAFPNGEEFDAAIDDLFRHQRFDNIAGATQLHFERMMLRWIETWVRLSGVRDIACSGGAFMNVKANQVIAESTWVDSIVVVPSCGDESVSIGAALYGYQKANGTATPIGRIKGLYLGRTVDNAAVEAALADADFGGHYTVTREADINGRVAELLARGEVVARCAGRSEFGARALGNRSILADPSRPDSVHFINEAVKNRDFWMPFAPSIMEEKADLYLRNPKNQFSPYMMLTFDSTEEGRRRFIAAQHQYDFTMRAQIVTADFNRQYHALLRRFGDLTGTYGVLNTSFNLHGEPIVSDAPEALRAFVQSGLKYMALCDYLLVRNG